jgi:uncharacterized membrane protein
MLGDPVNGGFWVGSPFFSPYWELVRDRRDPASPAWRPRFGNGSLVRTMTQDGTDPGPFEPWGPIRLVYLNYGSDPIVNFTAGSALRRPDWLTGERARDVAPEVRWFPLVTLFQLALDSAISLQVERFGHYYVAPDYIDGWALLLEPEGWNAERAAALKAIFAERGPAF